MCYFIYLRLVSQRKPDEAKALAAAELVAGRHGLYLDICHSALMIAKNGHCACDLVLKQKRFDAPITDFVRELAGQSIVKSVEIGYRWVTPMSADAPMQRFSVEDFASVSNAGGLLEDTWYRVNDPSRYDFGGFVHEAPAI